MTRAIGTLMECQSSYLCISICIFGPMKKTDTDSSGGQLSKCAVSKAFPSSLSTMLGYELGF